MNDPVILYLSYHRNQRGFLSARILQNVWKLINESPINSWKEADDVKLIYIKIYIKKISHLTIMSMSMSNYSMKLNIENH